MLLSGSQLLHLFPGMHMKDFGLLSMPCTRLRIRSGSIIFGPTAEKGSGHCSASDRVCFDQKTSFNARAEERVQSERAS